MYILRDNKGFTLIEVCIVVAIIAVAAAVAIPSFIDWLPHMRLKEATRDIASNIQLTRLQAVSTNTNTSLIFTLASESYTLGTHTYSLPDSVNFGGGPAAGNGVNGLSYAADGVSFTADTITFQPNGQINNNENGAIYITNDDADEAYAIEVRTTGKVTIYYWDGSSWVR